MRSRRDVGRLAPRCLTLAALAMSTVLASAPAGAAGLTKVWVSSKGADGAGCGPIAAPCRTFTGALSVVAPSGEIDVKDPGAYGPGPILITQAVSIVNDGVGVAGVQAPSGQNAFTVQAGANDAVSIIGLRIEGGGVANNGVEFDSGAALTMRHCTVRDFYASGVWIAATSGSVQATFADVIASENGNDGLAFAPNSGSASFSGVFDHVVAIDNYEGVGIYSSFTSGTVSVTVSNSVIDNNGGFGFYFGDNSSGTNSLNMESSTFNQNDVGVGVEPNALTSIFISDASATGNASYGLYNNGVVHSFGNNLLSGNGTDVYNLSALSRVDALR